MHTLSPRDIRKRGNKYRASASNELEYRFEELPLLSDGPASGGLVSGTATIAIHIDGGRVEWFVHEIYLDGFRKKEGGGFDKVFMKVEDDTSLYLTIWSELTDGSFRESVTRFVNEQAADMVGSAA